MGGREIEYRKTRKDALPFFFSFYFLLYSRHEVMRWSRVVVGGTERKGEGQENEKIREKGS